MGHSTRFFRTMNKSYDEEYETETEIDGRRLSFSARLARFPVRENWKER